MKIQLDTCKEYLANRAIEDIVRHMTWHCSQLSFLPAPLIEANDGFSSFCPDANILGLLRLPH